MYYEFKLQLVLISAPSHIYSLSFCDFFYFKKGVRIHV